MKEIVRKMFQCKPMGVGLLRAIRAILSFKACLAVLAGSHNKKVALGLERLSSAFQLSKTNVVFDQYFNCLRIF